jgi:chloride channel protein, CIC family
VALGKILTTGLTIGSGGSGGVFGPSMVIGGAGGGALGIVLHRIWPALAPHPATFVVIGMAGFFAAAAKTPFSTLVMVSELTGNYNLLLPTLWVCALTFLLSDEQSIYSSQVESRSRSPAHQSEFVRGMVSGLAVNQFISRNQPPCMAQPQDSLEKVLANFSGLSHTVLPVADPAGRLLGVISLEDAYVAVQLPGLHPVALAADLMRSDIVPLRLDDSIDHAMELFVENNVLELPVVDADDRVVGVVSRGQISSAYLHCVQGSNAGIKVKAVAHP